MLTDITNQFNHMINQVENSEVLNDPWPHMIVPEIIKTDDYRKFTEFDTAEGLIQDPIELEVSNRIEYALDMDNESQADIRYFNKMANKFFHVVADKFSLSFEGQEVLPTVRFWKDSNELLINDIHTDAFKDTVFTLSCLIYLPKDMSQVAYGSKLYEYIGNNLAEHTVQDPGTTAPHIVKKDCEEHFKCVRTLPFRPNCMFIAPNFDSTWHQAPTNIAEGDFRNSLMMRWKV